MTAVPTPPEGAAVDLDALKQALQAATPGPWSNDAPFTKVIDGAGPTDNLAVVQCDRTADAAVIVALRNLAPALLAEVREARGRDQLLRELAADLSRWAATNDGLRKAAGGQEGAAYHSGMRRAQDSAAKRLLAVLDAEAGRG